MKLLKKIGIGVLVLLVLLFVLTFVFPQNFSVSVSKEFEGTPPNVLYNIVNDLTLENEWNPWQQKDTSMHIIMGKITKGKGASFSWSSKKMGSGSSTYTESIENKKISAKLDFGGMGQGIAHYIFEPTESGTNMTWTLESKSSRPWNIMNFIIKNSVKKYYNQGLDNLGKIAKQRNLGTYRNYEIKELLVLDKNYIINRSVVNMSDVAAFYAKSLGPIFQKMQKADIEIKGNPCSIIYNYNNSTNKMDVAAGVPIEEEVVLMDTDIANIPGGKAIYVDYYGDYSKTNVSHDAIKEYLADRNLSYNWPIIEEYVSDPSEEKDPSKWLTKIIYYLSK